MSSELQKSCGDWTQVVQHGSTPWSGPVDELIPLVNRGWDALKHPGRCASQRPGTWKSALETYNGRTVSARGPNPTAVSNGNVELGSTGTVLSQC
jgi:hypothetical protein